MDQNKGGNQDIPETVSIPIGGFEVEVRNNEGETSYTVHTPSIQIGQSSNFSCNGYGGVSNQGTSYGAQCGYRF